MLLEAQIQVDASAVREAVPAEIAKPCFHTFSLANLGA
jgi:hypothetical protein